MYGSRGGLREGSVPPSIERMLVTEFCCKGFAIYLQIFSLFLFLKFLMSSGRIFNLCIIITCKEYFNVNNFF